MTEPVSIAGSSIIATATAVFLQTSGIDLPPVLWAAIGASFMQGHNQEQISRWQVAIHIVLSGLLGGLLGTVFVKMMPQFSGVDARHLTLLASAVCGFGSQPLMQRLLAKLSSGIDGGKP
jgi:hypothetical protein